MRRRYVFKVLVEPQKALSNAVHVVRLNGFQSLHYDNCHDMQQNVVQDLANLGFKRVKYFQGVLSATWCELC
jgi:hypothetical protein